MLVMWEVQEKLDNKATPKYLKALTLDTRLPIIKYENSELGCYVYKKDITFTCIKGHKPTITPMANKVEVFLNYYMITSASYC